MRSQPSALGFICIFLGTVLFFLAAGYLLIRCVRATVYVKEKARAAGTAHASYIRQKAQVAHSAASTLKTGISSRLNNAWKWLTKGQ